MAHPYDYMTLVELKLYMDISVDTDDTLLASIIDSVSTMFDSYIGYPVGLTTITETIDIEEDYIDTVNLTRYPNVSVVAMTNVNVAVLLADVSVKANTGRIKKNNGTYFTKGIAGLTVMYTTGYETIPDDLQLAAKDAASFIFNNRDSSGMISEKIGDYSYKLSPSAIQKGLTPFAEGVLKMYRRIS